MLIVLFNNLRLQIGDFGETYITTDFIQQMVINLDINLYCANIVSFNKHRTGVAV